MPPGAKHPQPGRASEAMPDPPPLAPFIRLGKIPQKYKRRRFPICAPPPSPQPPQPPRPQGVPPQPLERLQLSAYRLQRISRFAASIRSGTPPPLTRSPSPLKRGGLQPIKRQRFPICAPPPSPQPPQPPREALPLSSSAMLKLDRGGIRI